MSTGTYTPGHAPAAAGGVSDITAGLVPAPGPCPAGLPGVAGSARERLRLVTGDGRGAAAGTGPRALAGPMAAIDDGAGFEGRDDEGPVATLGAVARCVDELAAALEGVLGREDADLARAQALTNDAGLQELLVAQAGSRTTVLRLLCRALGELLGDVDEVAEQVQRVLTTAGSGASAGQAGSDGGTDTSTDGGSTCGGSTCGGEGTRS